MSGRGKGRNTGSGRGGGQRPRSGRSKNNSQATKKVDDKEKMKFTPYYTGKQQGATYDTVKDHVIKQVQRTYKFGNDIAMALENEKPYNNDDELYRSANLSLPE